VLQRRSTAALREKLIQTLQHAGIDLQSWLTGFDAPEDGVRRSVTIIRQHPLLPKDVLVHGLMICPETGRLDLLSDGLAAHMGIAAS